MLFSVVVIFIYSDRIQNSARHSFLSIQRFTVLLLSTIDLLAETLPLLQFIGHSKDAADGYTYITYAYENCCEEKMFKVAIVNVASIRLHVTLLIVASQAIDACYNAFLREYNKLNSNRDVYNLHQKKITQTTLILFRPIYVPRAFGLYKIMSSYFCCSIQHLNCVITHDSQPPYDDESDVTKHNKIMNRIVRRLSYKTTIISVVFCAFMNGAAYDSDNYFRFPCLCFFQC